MRIGAAKGAPPPLAEVSAWALSHAPEAHAHVSDQRHRRDGHQLVKTRTTTTTTTTAKDDGSSVVGSLSSYPEQPRWGPLDMSARPSIPVCEIPGCGSPAAVVMRAPAEVPGKEHPLCPAHASRIALRLGRVGVTYTSRPLAAA
jgi:hypothetical protein